MLLKKIMGLWQQTQDRDKAFKITSDFTPCISSLEYERAFKFVQDCLKAGRTYQVNYTQAFHAAYEGDPWAIYQRISTKNPVPYACFLAYS